MYEFKSGFANQLVEYLNFREALGFSKEHAKVLKYFDTFCFNYFPDRNLLTKDVVRGWFSHDIELGKKGFENKASAIRGFAKHIGNGAYILPMEYVPRTKQFVPYVPTKAELVALFNAAENFKRKNEPFINNTLVTMFKLMYSCGLRPNECRKLETKNVFLNTGELMITKTKRCKERIVVMSDEMLNIMKEYDLKRNISVGTTEFFFVKADGQPFSVQSFRNIFGKCWALANPDVESHLLPHLRAYDLRHCFASTVLHKWIDEGRNLYAMLPYLRAYMGHERLDDTAYYIHILPERLLSSPGVDWDRMDRIIPEVNIWTN